MFFYGVTRVKSKMVVQSAIGRRGYGPILFLYHSPQKKKKTILGLRGVYAEGSYGLTSH